MGERDLGCNWDLGFLESVIMHYCIFLFL